MWIGAERCRLVRSARRCHAAGAASHRCTVSERTPAAIVVGIRTHHRCCGKMCRKDQAGDDGDDRCPQPVTPGWWLVGLLAASTSRHCSADEIGVADDQGHNFPPNHPTRHRRRAHTHFSPKPALRRDLICVMPVFLAHVLGEKLIVRRIKRAKWPREAGGRRARHALNHGDSPSRAVRVRWAWRQPGQRPAMHRD